MFSRGVGPPVAIYGLRGMSTCMVELERSIWEIVEEVEKNIQSVTIEEAKEHEAAQSTFIDIRDIRELWGEGTIPNAKHVPRGMLEFWADPETEYYREFLKPENEYILFCNKAGRSALATQTLEELGYQNVSHLEGGFTAWKNAGGEVEDVHQKDYKNR